MIEKAIKDLREEYEKVKGFTFVNNPLAYALYQIWKKYDSDEKGGKNSGRK